MTFICLVIKKIKHFYSCLTDNKDIFRHALNMACPVK